MKKKRKMEKIGRERAEKRKEVEEKKEKNKNVEKRRRKRNFIICCIKLKTVSIIQQQFNEKHYAFNNRCMKIAPCSAFEYATKYG